MLKKKSYDPNLSRGDVKEEEEAITFNVQQPNFITQGVSPRRDVDYWLWLRSRMEQMSGMEIGFQNFGVLSLSAPMSCRTLAVAQVSDWPTAVHR
jgi:hypothetical protein